LSARQLAQLLAQALDGLMKPAKDEQERNDRLRAAHVALEKARDLGYLRP